VKKNYQRKEHKSNLMAVLVRNSLRNENRKVCPARSLPPPQGPPDPGTTGFGYPTSGTNLGARN
jgi:hypothetical protein